MFGSTHFNVEPIPSTKVPHMRVSKRPYSCRGLKVGISDGYPREVRSIDEELSSCRKRVESN